MNSPIRCIIIDDHQAIRLGVRTILSKMDGIDLVGEAENGPAGISMAAKRRPDVILLDVRMAGMDGFETCRTILAEDAEAHICIFTAHSDRQFVKLGIEAGAKGYLLKDAPGAELERAIRQVANGGLYIDATLAQYLADAGNKGIKLSPREKEMLEYLARGLTSPEIAAKLHLSPETVRTHVRNALTKMGASTRVQAVATAITQGLIDS